MNEAQRAILKHFFLRASVGAAMTLALLMYLYTSPLMLVLTVLLLASFLWDILSKPFSDFWLVGRTEKIPDLYSEHGTKFQLGLVLVWLAFAAWIFIDSGG